MAEHSIRMRWLDRVLSEDGPPLSTTKLVLATLGKYMNSDGRAFPGTKSLARDASLTDRAVRDHLARAVDSGYLLRETVGPASGQGWRRYRYQAVLPASGDQPERVTPPSPVTPASCVEGAGTEPARSGKGAEPDSSPSGKGAERHSEGAEPHSERCGTSFRKVRNHVPLNPTTNPTTNPPIEPNGGDTAPNAPDDGTAQPDLLTPQAGPPSGSRPKPSKGGDYPEAFERLWEARPRRAGGDPKPAAFRAWRARIQEGRITEQQAHAKVLEYRRYCEGTGKVGTETVQQLATFFGPVKEGYRQEWALPKPAGPSGQPSSYQGLSQKDYGKTRPGILGDDPDPPASDGNAGQVNHASKRTTDPNTTAHRWGRGTHAGILADAVESDQGGPGHE